MEGSTQAAPAVQSHNTKTHVDAKEHPQVNVYIWDMDETLILLKSLSDGTYARFYNGSKDLRKGMEIGKCWENHILKVCDEYFFYEEIENYNEPSLISLSGYDDGRDLSNYDFNNDRIGYLHDDSNKRKLAYRHRVIAQRYSQGLHVVLDQEMTKIWNDLYQLTDSYTDGWLSSGHSLLQQILGRNKAASHLGSSGFLSNSSETECENIHILVTSGSLVPSLVKCLLFRLDDVILHHNVYSSWEVGKLKCFSLIKERFKSPNVRFCVIGDGMEECQAAEKLKWPFIKIDLQPSGIHRFPGLTMRMMEHYMDVVYGPQKANDDEKN